MGNLKLLIFLFFLLACNRKGEEISVKSNSETATKKITKYSVENWCMYDYCCTGVPVRMDRKLVFKGKAIEYYQGDSLVYSDVIISQYYKKNKLSGFNHIYKLEKFSHITIIKNDSLQIIIHSRFNEADSEFFKLCSNK